MKKINYSVAMSLDGYISLPNGSIDWIIMDPEIDFDTFLNKVDTIFIGRHTYEFAIKQRGSAAMPGMKVYLFSRTLKTSDHPDVTVISENVREIILKIRSQSGKNIWLMGGGVPFLPSPGISKKLKLIDCKTYNSGIVKLQYNVL